MCGPVDVVDVVDVVNVVDGFDVVDVVEYSCLGLFSHARLVGRSADSQGGRGV